VIQGLDHVSVLVRDLGEATRAWSEILGRPPSFRGEHQDLGACNALFRLRNTSLELVAPTRETTYSAWLRKRLEREGEGLFVLGFATDDAAACARELRSAGLSVEGPREGQAIELDSEAVLRFRSVIWPPSQTRGVASFAIEYLSEEDVMPVRAPAGDPQAAVDALDHVVVQTSDPEAAIALYQDRLGLRLALDRTFPERGVRLLFFRTGGVTVEVAARLDTPTDPDARDRLWGLALQAPDVRAARARLAATGLDVSEMRRGNKAGTAVCTVRGEPSGVPTLLIGPD
jgi:catechol 2,3-dioxygenase-like lactoylglutathione lyase family enzyme